MAKTEMKMFRIYLNDGYIATGEYASAFQAKKAFANLFKINIRQFDAVEVSNGKPATD